MYKMKYLYVLMIIILPFSIFACKGKAPSVEDTLKERLAEHIRITNEVFYERARDTGKGTTIRLVGPVKVVIDKSGEKAITDTSIEIRYVNENSGTKAPLRVTWEFKNGNWSAENVLPEDFGFIISFDQKTLDKMKKK